jgi:hypothetical protein
MITSTIFECRCCGTYVDGKTSGAVAQPGWYLLDHIDGPNHICPACVELGKIALWGLKSDGYTNVQIGAACPMVEI